MFFICLPAYIRMCHVAPCVTWSATYRSKTSTCIHLRYYMSEPRPFTRMPISAPFSEPRPPLQKYLPHILPVSYLRASMLHTSFTKITFLTTRKLPLHYLHIMSYLRLLLFHLCRSYRPLECYPNIILLLPILNSIKYI